MKRTFTQTAPKRMPPEQRLILDTLARGDVEAARDQVLLGLGGDFVVALGRAAISRS